MPARRASRRSSATAATAGAAADVAVEVSGSPGAAVTAPAGAPALPRPGPPGVLRSDEPELELDEMQGNGLVGFNKDYQTYLFLAIERGEEGAAEVVREWVRAFAPCVSSAADVFAFNQLFRSMRRKHGQDPRGLIATWVNVAFSHAALETLAPPGDAALFGDELFRIGQAANASDLGDPDDPALEGHPSRWVVGGPGNEADIVVAVASDDRDILSQEVRRIEDGIYNGTTAGGVRVSRALRVIFKQHGATLPRPLAGHEHFGFKDGVSQPGVRGLATGAHAGEPITPRWVSPDDPVQRNPSYPEFARPGQPLLWPGEFVFGYPRQNRNDRREPGPPAMTCPAWARNGSYVVVRRLRQDVAGFRDWLRAEAARLAETPGFEGMTPVRLASILVGRWPSGAPLLRAQKADDPTVGRDTFTANHFTFRDDVPPLKLVPEARNREVAGAPGDMEGAVCPFAAHIRKVNPRDTDTEEGSELTLTRLILRRGIPFGTPLEEGARPEDDPLRGDRGLLFVSYQTSILEQFRFLQHRWANDASFPSGGGGPDPVIGQGTDDAGRRVRYVDLPAGDGTSATIEVPRDFVVATGGGYFFAPSIGALRYVLGGTPEERAAYVARLPPVDSAPDAPPVDASPAVAAANAGAGTSRRAGGTGRTRPPGRAT